MKESDIQITVVATLSAFAERGRFAFFSVPNEGSASGSGSDRSGKAFAKIAKLKKMGLVPGVADLVISKVGRVYYLEMKAPGQKQTKNQEFFEMWVTRCGCPYAVADTYEKAISILKHWKIL